MSDSAGLTRISMLIAERDQLRAERDAARAEVERLTDAAVIVQCEHPELDAVLAEQVELEQAFMAVVTERDELLDLRDKALAWRESLNLVEQIDASTEEHALAEALDMPIRVVFPAAVDAPTEHIEGARP